MENIIFAYHLALPTRNNSKKWSLPLTNYFVILTLSLTLFLVERFSSIGLADFFFLVLVGFFGVAKLSLVAGLSFSMTSSTNTYKFF